MTQVEQDYSNVFIDAVEDANRAATPWELQSVKCVTSVMRERLLAGPINLLQAFQISCALPLALYVALASPPLTKWVKAHSKFIANSPARSPAPRPAPHLLMTKRTRKEPRANVDVAELIADVTQGLRAWYYLVAQAELSSGQTVPVFFILYQTAIHARKGVAAWACMVSGTTPGYAEPWLTKPCVAFLDTSQVSVYADRVTIQSSEVTGYIDFSGAPHAVTVDIKFLAAPAFAFAVTLRSEFGPVVHARGKSVTANGLLQTRRWSFVDGRLASARIRVAGAAERTAAAGTVWFDFQQQGLARLSPIARMIASAMKTPSVVQSWLEVCLQTPYTAVYVNLKEPQNGQAGWWLHGHCTVWTTAQGVRTCRYGVPVSVHALAVDVSSNAPVNLSVQVHGVGEFVVTGRPGAPAAASFIASLLYIIPCTVAVLGTDVVGTGAIQFVPPTLTKAEIIMSAGLSSRLLHAFEPSKTAQAALVLSVFVLVCVMVSAVTALATLLRHRH